MYIWKGKVKLLVALLNIEEGSQMAKNEVKKERRWTSGLN